MKPFDTFILACSSALGLGYMPKAPGTFGTLMGIPIWWAMSGLWWPWQIAVTAASILFAIWVSSRAEAIYGEHDVQKIVIDEVVGLMTTVIAVPFAPKQIVAAFILFRLFDIIKPPPIRALDKKVEGGFGVVIDDVVAGLFALGIMHGAAWLWGGWW